MGEPLASAEGKVLLCGLPASHSQQQGGVSQPAGVWKGHCGAPYTVQTVAGGWREGSLEQGCEPGRSQLTVQRQLFCGKGLGDPDLGDTKS